MCEIMELFRPDSKPMQLMSAFADMILLNLCWLLTSLPLVTAGTSTAAIYTVLEQNARGEGAGVVGRYFRAWRLVWKPATAFWLLQLAVSLLLGCNVLLFARQPGLVLQAVLWLSVLTLVLVWAASPLVYAQLGRYQNTFAGFLKNALLLTLGNLWRMLLCLVILALPVLVSLLLLEQLLRSSFLWITFGFSAVFYLVNRVLMPVLSPLEQLCAETGPVNDEEELL